MTKKEYKTKSEMINIVAHDADVTQAVARDCIEAALRYIKEQLNAGTEVRLVEFGTFRIQHRARREARNIHTGERISVAPKRRAAFKPSANLIEEPEF